MCDFQAITESKEIYQALEDFLQINNIKYKKIRLDKYKSNFEVEKNKFDLVCAFCLGYWRRYDEVTILPF